MRCPATTPSLSMLLLAFLVRKHFSDTQVPILLNVNGKSI